MATAAELKEQLRAKMANSASTESTQPQQDRFIKGTLIDDKAIAFFQKLATIIFIVAIIGLLWLWLERNVGTRVISPYRVWVPSIYMVVMMFWIKPFLNLGWLGWGFAIVQSINLSGYLFQAIQTATGVR
ncbi:MAG: hypothetical protein ACOVVP_00445 [Pseudanabaena sp.]